MNFILPIGATITPAGTRFRVWAERAQQVDVVLYQGDQPGDSYAMQPTGAGYYELLLPNVGAGTQYMYRLDGATNRPDPVSRFQPLGVHGPTQVVDPAVFSWNDSDWRGLALEDAVIYELHIGTFTPEGTFDSAIEKLDQLVELGVSAIEIMPVADFPGRWNWGYDGVSLFAPSRAYGGPEALRRLVDAAHKRGLAVVLDVVYNHFGPDGNYLRDFSLHYFTHKHTTPWGDALNFDDVEAEHVRSFFTSNACYWANEYHLDGLRLDATHAIKDDSPTHILAEIAASVRASLPVDRQFLLIAEDERNEPGLVRGRGDIATRRPDDPASATERSPQSLELSRQPPTPNYGLDALWADDFHHQVRVALTGEQEGYFGDYSGSVKDLVATLRQGWFYTGQQSQNLGAARGAPADDVAPPAFVYHIQNHDQVGNRAIGDRLSSAVSLEAYRAATVLLLCTPYLPMLWQGQEWAASTPFLFFTDHNAELGRLITEGRRREFERFAAFAGEQVPDPQAESTFLESKLNWAEREQPPHDGILQLYHDLLHLRRRAPALQTRSRDSFDVEAIGEDGLMITQRGDDQTLLFVINLRGKHNYTLPVPHWNVVLSSEEARYGGANSTQLLQNAASFEGPGALALQAVQPPSAAPHSL